MNKPSTTMQHRFGPTDQLPPWRQYHVADLWDDDPASAPPPLSAWSTVPTKREAVDGSIDLETIHKRVRENSIPIKDEPLSHDMHPNISSGSESPITSASHHPDRDATLGSSPVVARPSEQNASKPAAGYTAIKQIIKHMQKSSDGPKPKKGRSVDQCK